jgi:hypothetical protein
VLSKKLNQKSQKLYDHHHALSPVVFSIIYKSTIDYSTMTTNSLSVSNFVSDRKSDVIQQNSSTPLSLTKRKLRLERLLYRSRSFRRRKRCKTFRNVSTQKISSKLLKIAVNSSGVNFKQPTYNWHCKRFTMTKECGYFVPCFSNSLSVQSFEKRLNKSCIVHDQSYMRCVIVTVDENTFSYLSRIMVSSTMNNVFVHLIYLLGFDEQCVVWLRTQTGFETTNR